MSDLPSGGTLRTCELVTDFMPRIEHDLASKKTWLGHLFSASLFYLVPAGTSWYKVMQAKCDLTDECHVQWAGPKLYITSEKALIKQQ